MNLKESIGSDVYEIIQKGHDFIFVNKTSYLYPTHSNYKDRWQKTTNIFECKNCNIILYFSQYITTVEHLVIYIQDNKDYMLRVYDFQTKQCGVDYKNFLTCEAYLIKQIIT